MSEEPLLLTKGSSNSNPQIVTIQSDNSLLPPRIILNETNYALWSQVMEMRIVAREIKDAVKKTFYDGGDESYLYDLNKRAFTMKQNGTPVHTYYNQLQIIFQEIDHRSPISMQCAADLTTRQLEIDRLCVHIFLAGLDPEFYQVRGEILRKDPKLDLENTFAYVRRDAQQRMSMNGANDPQDASIMATHRQKGAHNSPGIFAQNKASGTHPKKKCTHCGGSKHTRAGCYELIGYPNWWDHSKAPQKNRGKALQVSSDYVPDIITNKTIGCGTRRGKL
ncbi:uncharacterized protein LOC110770066 [Prunus avium]|uniref:Uncharacterized protein LOC110770066 n=1 Tax=Prunus avium TaxID=42229 RepID=A0A6P5TRT5_PRUAV|nr:uncharacterized protein LOC110770066 [Prunus avium]